MDGEIGDDCPECGSELDDRELRSLGTLWRHPARSRVLAVACMLSPLTFFLPWYSDGGEIRTVLPGTAHGAAWFVMLVAGFTLAMLDRQSPFAGGLLLTSAAGPITLVFFAVDADRVSDDVLVPTQSSKFAYLMLLPSVLAVITAARVIRRTDDRRPAWTSGSKILTAAAGVAAAIVIACPSPTGLWPSDGFSDLLHLKIEATATALTFAVAVVYGLTAGTSAGARLMLGASLPVLYLLMLTDQQDPAWAAIALTALTAVMALMAEAGIWHERAQRLRLQYLDESGEPFADDGFAADGFDPSLGDIADTDQMD